MSTEGDVNEVIRKYSQHNTKIITEVELPPPKDNSSLIGKKLFFTDTENNPRNTFFLRESWLFTSRIMTFYKKIMSIFHVFYNFS